MVYVFIVYFAENKIKKQKKRKKKNEKRQHQRVSGSEMVRRKIVALIGHKVIVRYTATATKRKKVKKNS